MDVDEGLVCLGKWSRWQMLMYVVINLTLCFPASWHMLAIVFVGLEPTIHCQLPHGMTADNSTIPWDEENQKLDSCSVFANFTHESGESVPCPNGMHYGDEVFSIVNEWDLSCENAYLVSMSQTVLVAGVFVGAVVMALAADYFGRKPAFLGSIMGISLLGFIASWANSYVLLTVLRFFIGVFQQGVVLPGFVMSCELFPADQRTIAGLIMQCFWALGMFALALMAYLTQHWRHLMLCISLPGFLAIPLFWLLPESIPWLVAVGRVHEAKIILNKAAAFNKVKLPKRFQLTEEEAATPVPSTWQKLSSVKSAFKRQKPEQNGVSKPPKENDVAQYTVLDILKSFRLLIFSLIMCYLWCVSALVYYGLSLNTGSLAGSPYLNFFLSGLVEIPAYITAALMLQYIGRRISIAFFYVLAGTPLFITLFLNPTSTISVVLAMIGKLGISAAFGSVFLYAPELFPTTIRNIGIGVASVGGRIGNVVAPFTPLVAKAVPWLPNVIFGVISLVAGGLTFLLPETLHRPLPVTIQEVEQWRLTLTKEEKEYAKMAAKASKEKNLMLAVSDNLSQKQSGDMAS